MSTHLIQQTLTGNAVALVKELEAWLANVDFKPEGKDITTCEYHKDFKNIMKRLVNELEFIHIKDPVPAFNAFRIPTTASGSVEVLVSTGPAYVIPLHISKNDTMVSSLSFMPGTATLVTSGVKVNQGFEFLVIAPPQE